MVNRGINFVSCIMRTVYLTILEVTGTLIRELQDAFLMSKSAKYFEQTEKGVVTC